MQLRRSMGMQVAKLVFTLSKRERIRSIGRQAFTVPAVEPIIHSGWRCSAEADAAHKNLQRDSTRVSKSGERRIHRNGPVNVETTLRLTFLTNGSPRMETNGRRRLKIGRLRTRGSPRPRTATGGPFFPRRRRKNGRTEEPGGAVVTIIKVRSSGIIVKIPIGPIMDPVVGG